jgi:nitrite reductase/ring-hydroxylating ferredoxin subunit
MVAWRPAGAGVRPLSPGASGGGATAEGDIRLCRLDDIPDGDSRGFDPLKVGRDTMLIVRKDKALYAWRDACPHIDGVPMAWRKDAYLNASGDRIVCSAHGALFDISTGVCTLGPCLGQSLERMAVLLDADGSVYWERPAPRQRETSRQR